MREPEGNANLSSVFEKLHFGHLLENFQREKVTVDRIYKLSSKQMECCKRSKHNNRQGRVAAHLSILSTSQF